MTFRYRNKVFALSIAAVWLVNGLFCKVLGLVPRHQQIVARILGDDFSKLTTISIGLAETGMAIWILSRFKPRLSALVQIAIVLIMNTLELILAPDLLLWGKANLLFALLFALVVYLNGFYINRQLPAQA